jgi:hypothetical protein
MRIAGLTLTQVAKIASLSFVVGACMELFMIKTGFYSIVTRYSIVLIDFPETIDADAPNKSQEGGREAAGGA